MRRLTKLMLLLTMLLVIRVDLVLPQASISNSEIRGQVTDPNSGAVASATVTITEINKGTTRTVKTDEAGTYVLLSLQPGTYNMKVEAKGFAGRSDAARGQKHVDAPARAKIEHDLAFAKLCQRRRVAAA